MEATLQPKTWKASFVSVFSKNHHSKAVHCWITCSNSFRSICNCWGKAFKALSVRSIKCVWRNDKFFRAEDSHTSAIWDISLIILKALILCSYPETTVFNLTNKQGKIFSSWGDVYLFMLINENKVSSGTFHLKLTKNQLKVAGELKEFR